MNRHVDLEFAYNHIQLCTMSILNREYIRYGRILEIRLPKNTTHFKQRLLAEESL